MTASITRTRKKRGRGRPPTGSVSIHLRVVPILMAGIDEWMTKQDSPAMGRPEAIYRLIELGLAAAAKRGRTK